eukprot:46167-Prorocentrum_minimum.AAC.3
MYCKRDALRVLESKMYVSPNGQVKSKPSPFEPYINYENRVLRSSCKQTKYRGPATEYTDMKRAARRTGCTKCCFAPPGGLCLSESKRDGPCGRSADRVDGSGTSLNTIPHMQKQHTTTQHGFAGFYGVTTGISTAGTIRLFSVQNAVLKILMLKPCSSSLANHRSSMAFCPDAAKRHQDSGNISVWLFWRGTGG